MKRTKKKSTKSRGSRYGRGNTKNGRGSGCKGGVGHAGSFMHKFSQMLKYYPEQFDVSGFHCPTTRKVKEINVFEINNMCVSMRDTHHPSRNGEMKMAKKGEISQKDGKYSFEFDGKVLGDGEISVPVLVKAKAASKSAQEKITKAGGSITLPAPKPEAVKTEAGKEAGKKPAPQAPKKQ